MNKNDLKQLSEELCTQDNLGTAQPIFIVYERKKQFGMIPDYSDEYEWFDLSECCYCGKTSDLEDEDGKPMTEEQAEGSGYQKDYFIQTVHFRNAHFTRKAAELYISENGHNLTDPYVFVETMHYCHEMIAIREHLMGITSNE